jgi:hypothetical protein
LLSLCLSLSLAQDFYTETISATYRITHHKDPVPHLPWESWGFHHEAREVFYDRDNDGTFLAISPLRGQLTWALAAAFTLCDDSGEDPNCCDQYYVDVCRRWVVAVAIALDVGMQFS